jgi:quercetin dioxygenase-like cupin family protein
MQDKWSNTTPKRVIKGWGWEDWICNNEFYCGKILFFHKEKKCSFHYHNIKKETFYLAKGKLLIKHSFSDDLNTADETILNQGEAFEIPIGLRHQMIALEESELFEFSTSHYETDSYRIVKGD